MVETTSTAPPAPTYADIASAHAAIHEVCAKRTPPVIASALSFPKKATPDLVLVVGELPTQTREMVDDLASSFTSRGCKVTIHSLGESEEAARPLALARVIAERAPHLVVAFNHTRATLGGAVPENVPIVSWITELSASHFNVPDKRPLEPLDVIIGNVRPDMAKFHGFPRGRCVHVPQPASVKAFHDRPVSDKARDKFLCHVACYSADSGTPEFLHASHLAKVRGDETKTAFFNELYPGLVEIAESPLSAGPVLARARALIQTHLLLKGLASDRVAIAEMLTNYGLPLVHRIALHRTLGELAKTCAEQRWKLYLYGPGWEDHETLAECAKGELASPEALRTSYQCARAHLFFPMLCCMPTGAFQCALSGGLPLIRNWADNIHESSTLNLGEYLPDMAALMFHDKTTLERGIVRARDDDWRSMLRTKLMARALSKATPDAAAQRILTLATDHLAVCQLEAA